VGQLKIRGLQGALCTFSVLCQSVFVKAVMLVKCSTFNVGCLRETLRGAGVVEDC
jgi:hypothetical protein